MAECHEVISEEFSEKIDLCEKEAAKASKEFHTNIGSLGFSMRSWRASKREAFKVSNPLFATLLQLLLKPLYRL